MSIGKGPQAWVYFFLSPDTGLVKIGFTVKGLAKRLNDMRNMNPGQLVPIGVMKGGRRLEKELHDKFWSKNDHGEWFDWDEELKAFVSDHARPWPHEDWSNWKHEKIQRIDRLHDMAKCRGCDGVGESSGSQCEECGGSGMKIDSRYINNSGISMDIEELDPGRTCDRKHWTGSIEHKIERGIEAVLCRPKPKAPKQPYKRRKTLAERLSEERQDAERRFTEFMNSTPKTESEVKP